MNLNLKSERLLLRPLAEPDSDVGIETFTDPAVTRYICQTYTEEQVIEEMPTVTKRCAEGCIGIWCVIDQSTEEKLGTATNGKRPTLHPESAGHDSFTDAW